MRVRLENKKEITIDDVNSAHFIIGLDKSGNWMQLREVSGSEPCCQWHPIFACVTGTFYDLIFSSRRPAIRNAITEHNFEVFAFTCVLEVQQFIANYGDQK